MAVTRPILAPSLSGVRTDVMEPRFAITIEDEEFDDNMARCVTSVEYESADGIADMARIRILNPDGMFTDRKAFQAGLEMNVAFGYGTLQHVGRVVLAKPVFDFPEAGMPTIEIVGYSAECLMQDGRRIMSKRKQKMRKKDKPRGGPWKKLSEVLYDKLHTHDWIKRLEFSFKHDVIFERPIIQRANMSDYDLLKGLANLFGYVFWVEGNAAGEWTVHFKRPDTNGVLPDLQTSYYTFRYAVDGHDNALLSFRPEYCLRGVKTKVYVETLHAQTGKLLNATVTDDAAEPEFEEGDVAEAKLLAPPGSGASIKVFFDDYQVEVVPNKRFTTEAQLAAWALVWFRRHREQFILAEGRIIGMEDVLARQTHRVEGISRTFDGHYYFSRVNHTLNESGYTCEINARRLLFQPDPPKPQVMSSMAIPEL